MGKRLSPDFLYPNNEIYTKLNALTLHPDGHIIVGGSSHEYVPYPFTNYNLVEAKVWKLDTSGNVVWSKVFPTVNKSFSGTSEIAHVQCDTAGNVVCLVSILIRWIVILLPEFTGCIPGIQ
ncbi:MAG: hypothetical protein HWD58_02705 [Bacteroidota bacterium]|nr:MAG: hypothetical protein HWD58_02705 [Bacteroidota bacterium]